MLALIVAGVVVLAGVGVALWLTVGRSGTSTLASSTTLATQATPVAPTTPGTQEGSPSQASPSDTADAGGATTAGIPPATQQPTGLGDDPVDNQYAQECFDGDMESCDALYIILRLYGTPYSRFADTCAGRQPEGTDQLCEDTFPG